MYIVQEKEKVTNKLVTCDKSRIRLLLLLLNLASESGGYNNHLRVQTLERPSNLKLQESNPIYDGAVYETMPGESFKALLSPTSTPTTPATDSATRYLFDTNVLPNLPPPRKESAGQMPILDSDKEKVLLNGAEMPNLISNDAMEYMIMQNTSSVSNEVKTMGDI